MKVHTAPHYDLEQEGTFNQLKVLLELVEDVQLLSHPCVSMHENLGEIEVYLAKASEKASELRKSMEQE